MFLISVFPLYIAPENVINLFFTKEVFSDHI